MFSWFFRKESPLDLHTKFLSSTSWVAELNEPINKEFIYTLFYTTFEFEHFQLSKTNTSIVAVLPAFMFFAKLTFGKTKECDVVVITFSETEENDAVSTVIRVFGEELERYGLLKDMQQKLPKTIQQKDFITFHQFAYENDVELSETDFRCSVILRSTLPPAKIVEVVTQILNKKTFTSAKDQQTLVFTKENDKMTLAVGKNEEGQTVMNMQWSAESPNWLTISELICNAFTEFGFLLSFEKVGIKGNTKA
ncbi:hypothetical protein EIN_181550 [Entamoeba invadens IP1]|uniref:hypothetical protein n=1 Tax=Entamoeba invadens IP1 TaxID=370355 RepID=UPI0002C3F193|nr:hypothetical protein EIN_181550 [Entamoeba invadens IP1]ELP93988.1 hypothetical protein EIN_181550 [Entamoeba invadens IP1]|eukprot:XP_004260759.1 hypothetical protein EIN_181550 [Entamoeba invadens IP1]